MKGHSMPVHFQSWYKKQPHDAFSVLSRADDKDLVFAAYSVE